MPDRNHIYLFTATTVYIGIACAIWWILPGNYSLALGASWVAGCALAATWLVFQPAIRAHSFGRAQFFSPKFLGEDLLLVAAPIFLGVLLDSGLRTKFMLSDTGIIFLKYIPWAWIQLVLFLFLPVRVMSLAIFKPKLIIFICSVIFVLLHLPNPLLMAFTGLAMLIWTRQYMQGRRLLAICLVMALAATAMKITVPAQWSGDLRIGPNYLAHYRT